MADNGQRTIDHAMIRRLLSNVQRHIAEWTSCESHFRHTVRAASGALRHETAENAEKKENFSGVSVAEQEIFMHEV